MKGSKRSRAGIAVLAGMALVLAGCGLLGFESWTWHQKLTIEVETPDGVKTGSAVVRVERATTPKWLPGQGAGGMGYQFAGEASVVEVAPGRYLFALLKGRNGYDGYVAELAQKLFFDRRSNEEIARDPFFEVRTLEHLRESREVPPSLYPLMVTFGEIDDPKTVRRVDAADLDAAFPCPAAQGGKAGTGPSGGMAATGGRETFVERGRRQGASPSPACYRLRSVTLEITSEPVTKGRVEKMLGWLYEIWPNRLDGDRFGNLRSKNRFANSLSANSFSTEIRK